MVQRNRLWLFAGEMRNFHPGKERGKKKTKHDLKIFSFLDT